MAIVADFTADVTGGEGPLTVTFTDVSSGSPDKWIWDFGDGTQSNVQHPVHTYLEDGDYTVTLNAFISSSTDVSSDRTIASFEFKLVSGGSEPAAHAAWLAASWTTGSVGSRADYHVDPSGGGARYFGVNSNTNTIDLSGDSGKKVILEAKFANVVIVDHHPMIDGIVFEPGDLNEYKFALNLTSRVGTSFTLPITDKFSNSTPGYSGVIQGWQISRIRTIKYTTSDEDTETKVDFITVGVVVDAPVAAFSGTPRKKLNSLTCQLTDESTNAPTSWSWKRRPSGILAPYVEFSTNENPSEGFDITSPTP